MRLGNIEVVNTEKSFKWLCLFLTAVVLYMGAYNWRDQRAVNLQIKANTLANTVSQLQRIAGMPADVIGRVNNVFNQTGYQQFVYNLPVPDSIPSVEEDTTQTQ